MLSLDRALAIPRNHRVIFLNQSYQNHERVPKFLFTPNVLNFRTTGDRPHPIPMQKMMWILFRDEGPRRRGRRAGSQPSRAQCAVQATTGRSSCGCSPTTRRTTTSTLTARTWTAQIPTAARSGTTPNTTTLDPMISGPTPTGQSMPSPHSSRRRAPSTAQSTGPLRPLESLPKASSVPSPILTHIHIHIQKERGARSTVPGPVRHPLPFPRPCPCPLCASPLYPLPTPLPPPPLLPAASFPSKSVYFQGCVRS